MRGRGLLVAIACAAMLLTGCGKDRGDVLQVSAAASLTEAFTALGTAFEADHPDVDVTFDFAASSALAERITQGEPADVFASADEASMRKVTDAGRAAHPSVMARNRLAIVVEKGNPKGVKGLADLANPDLVLAMCAPEVPCGALGAAALAQARVTARPASLEENVKAVMAKVTLGEADAGLVYATDVRAARDKVDGVRVGGGNDPALEAVYPIALVEGSDQEAVGAAWIEFVLSTSGQATLRRFGFLAP